MHNLNPVAVAKHFQYGVEKFFTRVLLSNAEPFGKIVYYALIFKFWLLFVLRMQSYYGAPKRSLRV